MAAAERSPAPTAQKHRKRARTKLRPLIVQGLIFVAMLVIFLLFLRYVTREPGSETGRMKFRESERTTARDLVV